MSGKALRILVQGFLLLYCAGHPAYGQHRTFCIGFYNVENLFDAVDDPATDDAEFTPEGNLKWTTERATQKASNIARVIEAMNHGHGPDVLGLSEVENAAILEHLLQQGKFLHKAFGYVHADSRDQRGIDVCLIYRRKAFQPIGYRLLPVDLGAFAAPPTRDVLLVSGLWGKRDTLHVLVCHWPSRRGGKEATEARRLAAARIVRRAVDSLLLINSRAQIVVMGDFNDNPPDSSLLLLQFGLPDSDRDDLLNCATRFDWRRGEGTEFYRGQWSRFIQILLSPAMARYGLAANDPCAGITIFRPDWMLKTDPATGQRVPLRSVEENGTIGFSDHLPVYLLLRHR